MTTLDRLAKCGVYKVPTAPCVTVLRDSDGVASIGGLQVCGLVWACPCCSAKIRQSRSTELEGLVLRHVNSGGGAAFGTLTLPHDRVDKLKPLLRTVATSWQKVRQSRGVRRAMTEHGVIGFVRAVEITVGGRNGWHPHLHVLALTKRPLDAAALADLGSAIADAWCAAVVAAGYRRPSDTHGVRWQPVAGETAGQELARYLTKVQDSHDDSRSIGSEMARGDLKSGRGGNVHPFDVLDAAIQGDRHALQIWWEYEQATRGHRVLTWSTGLRAALNALPEVDDETVAAQEETGSEVIAELSDSEWRLVVRGGYESMLLDVAELEGATGVAELLREVAVLTRDDFDVGASPPG